MIFIESAALSLIAKILQLAIPSLGSNPIVVPLCTISSNLIVLRKALGADIGDMLAKKPQELSTLRFHPRRTRDGEHQTSEFLDTSIPGGFGAHLIQTIGGRIIDIGPLDADNSEQSSLSNMRPKEGYAIPKLQVSTTWDNDPAEFPTKNRAVRRSL